MGDFGIKKTLRVNTTLSLLRWSEWSLPRALSAPPLLLPATADMPASSSGSNSKSNLHNADSIDLQPTPKQQRTSSACEMAALWVSIVVSVPAYYLAGSLVDLGMSWWEGVATVVAGNSIITFCLVLSGRAGSCYGIPYPVLARSAFGSRGAHIATLIRSLIACGWFSIESWIGGQAIFLLLPSSLQKSSALGGTIPWLGTSPLEFACFVLFWLIQLMMLWKGMIGIRWLEKFSAPVLTVLVLWLLGWAYVNAGGSATCSRCLRGCRRPNFGLSSSPA